MSVDVPPAFAALGFSGLFWTTTGFPDAATRDSYRAKVPCLLKDTGWMLLEIVDGVGTLVRRDVHAILDITIKAREVEL